jgi:hypothetical protein
VNRISNWIDDPILAHTAAIVQIAFDPAISPADSWRKDFNDNRRRPAHVLFSENFGLIAKNDEHVRFYDIEIGEHAIERAQNTWPIRCRRKRISKSATRRATSL